MWGHCGLCSYLPLEVLAGIPWFLVVSPASCCCVVNYTTLLVLCRFLRPHLHPFAQRGWQQLFCCNWLRVGVEEKDAPCRMPSIPYSPSSQLACFPLHHFITDGLCTTVFCDITVISWQQGKQLRLETFGIYLVLVPESWQMDIYYLSFSASKCLGESLCNSFSPKIAVSAPAVMLIFQVG